jgi:hypothetical protein
MHAVDRLNTGLPSIHGRDRVDRILQYIGYDEYDLLGWRNILKIIYFLYVDHFTTMQLYHYLLQAMMRCLKMNWSDNYS